ncbi:hypothetical protein F4553_001936 [Allocatelliglobosispora scoriae]|uniref:Uncharacterized protein n=1 Tax=Allocatelliglobosispora scoriae TaxID=643052 RepID=A0A841BHI7_9ACTN|nr:hypothetical protein [Allocatelliglobosispora scoriae]
MAGRVLDAPCAGKSVPTLLLTLQLLESSVRNFDS